MGAIVIIISIESIRSNIILREIEKAEHRLHFALRLAPFVLLRAVGHKAAAGVEHGFFGAEVHAAQRHVEGSGRMVAGIAREAAVIAARRGFKRKDYTIKDPCYQMFDFCTLEEFEGKKKSVNFTGRYAQMQKMMKGNKFPEIKLLKQELIKTQEDFDRWTKYVEDGNWEGFMLRKDIPFETGRSKNLLKVKKFMDDDFVVKDLECAEMTPAKSGSRSASINLLFLIPRLFRI